MAIIGYRNRCGSNKGGIKSIKFVGAEKIVSLGYDQHTDSFSTIELAAGAEFVEFEFGEDRAAYRETTSVQSGSSKVVHELTFAVDRNDAALARVVGSLARNNAMVAMVTDNNGQTRLVGYSRRFGKERPLRIVQSVADSGAALANRGAVTVRLRSEDTETSKAYL